MDHNQNGKAFEYACLLELYLQLHKKQKVIFLTDMIFSKRQNYFESLNRQQKEIYIKSAKAGIKLLREMDPRIEKEDLYIKIQKDNKGLDDDVRDIICYNDFFEVGISCKHHSTCIKHPFISYKTDISKLWLNLNCTHAYEIDMKQIFDYLYDMTRAHKYWSEVNKTRVYELMNKAIINELIRQYKTYGSLVPEQLSRYFLGQQDYYKIIADDQYGYTFIEAYNHNGTLNPSIAKLPLPTKFIRVDFYKNYKSVICIKCNNGWAFTMRLHNNTRLVNPWLLYEVKILTYPKKLNAMYYDWKEYEGETICLKKK